MANVTRRQFGKIAGAAAVAVTAAGKPAWQALGQSCNGTATLVKGNLATYWAGLQTSEEQSPSGFAWTQFSIGSAGENAGNYFHPSLPQTVFQAQNEFNTYVSSNLGKNWQTVLDSDGTGSRSFELSRSLGWGFGAKPGTQSFGFSVALQGLWTTANGGSSWQSYNQYGADGAWAGNPASPNPNALFPVPVTGFGTTALSAVGVSQKDTSPSSMVVYLGSGSATDDTNWPTANQPMGIAAGTVNPGKMFYSSNGGNTWVSLPISASVTPIWSSSKLGPIDMTQASFIKIFVHPIRDYVAYACTNVGVFVTRDSGQSWHAINDGLDFVAATPNYNNSGNCFFMRDMDMYWNASTQTVQLFAIQLVQWTSDGSGNVSSPGGGIFTWSETCTQNGFSAFSPWVSIQGNLPTANTPGFGLGFNLKALSQLQVEANDSSTSIQQMFNNVMNNWFPQQSGSGGSGCTQGNPPPPPPTYNLPTSFVPNPVNVVVDRGNPNVIYVANSWRFDISTYPESVFMTTDGGQTWYPAARWGLAWGDPAGANVAGGGLGAYYNNLTDPSFPGETLGVVKGKTSRTNIDFTTINVTLGDQALRPEFSVYYPWVSCKHLAISAVDTTGYSNVIVDTHKQCIVTANQGTSWSQVDTTGTAPSLYLTGNGNSNVPGKNFYANPNTNEIVLTAGENGFWALVDAGSLPASAPLNKVTWQNAPPCSSPTAEGNLGPTQVEDGYAGALGPGPAGTAGLQILSLGTYFDEISPCSVLFDQSDTSGNTAYATFARQTGAGYLWKTTDGLRTWTLVSANDTPVIASICGGPHTISGGRVFQYSLIFAKNNPASHKMYFCVPNSIVIDEGTNDPNIYTGLYELDSDDGGNTWTSTYISGPTGLPSIPSGNSVNQIIVDPLNANVMYAAVLYEPNSGNPVNGGLYRSTSGIAGPWTVVCALQSAGVISVNDIHFDSSNQSVMYVSCGTAAGNGKGSVWMSTDRVNFTEIVSMPFTLVTRTDAGDPSHIAVSVGPCTSLTDYDTTQTQHPMLTGLNPGVYISRNGGGTWTKSNSGCGQSNLVRDLFWYYSSTAKTQYVLQTNANSGFYYGVSTS